MVIALQDMAVSFLQGLRIPTLPAKPQTALLLKTFVRQTDVRILVEGKRTLREVLTYYVRGGGMSTESLLAFTGP
jgi:hypothetical protein